MTPAMLFVAALYGQPERFFEAVDRLTRIFGPVLFETLPIPWDYSDFYKEEMGRPLYRSFVFFETLIGQDGLAVIKRKTIKIEGELSIGGRRTVNLDPGYLTEAKVVLASTKDYSHRIYLGEGIFGELALAYVKDGFKPHMNTYRDYIDSAGMFSAARGMFKTVVSRAAKR